MKATYPSFLAIYVLLAGATSLLAQGPLTPPAGAPAPTMKSLDQIEPRTPISALPFTITTGGHYYLTKSITTTGDGITIQASDVVVDLNGFTLTGDGGTGDVGAQTTGTRSRITARNGTLRSFNIGLLLSSDTSHSLAEDLVLSGNTNFGLFAASAAGTAVTTSVFRRLRASENGGAGITFGNVGFTGNAQNLIDQCHAVNNPGAGISISTPGNLIIRCAASGNTPNYIISPNNRFGVIVFPTTNPSSVNGNSGGAGTGTSDPFANITY